MNLDYRFELFGVLSVMLINLYIILLRVRIVIIMDMILVVFVFFGLVLLDIFFRIKNVVMNLLILVFLGFIIVLVVCL